MRFIPRHFKLSLTLVSVLALIVALSSCSKKDVVSDEPAISPSTTSDSEGGGTALGDGSVDSGAIGGGSGAGAGAGGAGELLTVYFAYDSFSLTSEARRVLKANSDWLNANPTSSAQIEGHCDERGTTEYNLALGERRANSVRDYLTRAGVDASRLSVISYGEERPSDSGSNESAWAKNRRASFVLLSR